MDLQDVMKLLELMEARNLDEIEVEQGDVRIRLRKGGAAPTMMPIIAAPVAASNGNPGPAAAPAAEKAAEEQNLVKISSPMVGTFYRASSPDAEPFINEGDHIAPDQVVCIIEAMKVMNEIKSEVEGAVVSILIENGESVEFGQPMITIRRTGPAR